MEWLAHESPSGLTIACQIPPLQNDVLRLIHGLGTTWVTNGSAGADMVTHRWVGLPRPVEFQLDRRGFLAASGIGSVVALMSGELHAQSSAPLVAELPGESLFEYIQRVKKRFDVNLYKQLIGSANPFKEGDQIVGVAAVSDQAREQARRLLAATRIEDLDAHPLLDDELYRLIQHELHPETHARAKQMTLGELKQYLLHEEEAAIHSLMPGLSSDVIGCVVKLMDNAELTAIGAKVFNPLPGSQIGAKGYLGARIQPNSPTDNVDDIRWQVFDGWSYAVGDVVLGNNPVSSDPHSVEAIERTLQDVLETFGVSDLLPHCVLSHVDVQADVEQAWPGRTALWFQSIAGSVTANATFDISIEKMERHATARTGAYGFYFETGQGADFTNGHGHGFDMVIHESRKYGWARVLTRQVADARAAAGRPGLPWVHVNDVAGFIGPEVFRTREQLVRCCLEDIVMGKLHGLCLGLDVCSTLHMDVSLDDLDWCLEQLVPAQPAYLMALPTKIDPMLGYLTTGFHDHVRLREKFGTRVNDAMWSFFQSLGVIDAEGRPTAHFGDPLWVYSQYRKLKGDQRPLDEILAEGRREIATVRSRGLFIAEGTGSHPGDLPHDLQQEVRRIYNDAKQCIWAELNDEFVKSVPNVVPLTTRSKHREDYILHPVSGETLSTESQATLVELRRQHNEQYDVQIVVSDGLNATSISDEDQLDHMLVQLRKNLKHERFRCSPEHLLIRSGRVRAGYRIGEALFGGKDGVRSILHIIGERPGSGHHTFSVYLTPVDGAVWGVAGKVDHNMTRVVAGISNTTLLPTLAAEETVRILKQTAR